MPEGRATLGLVPAQRWLGYYRRRTNSKNSLLHQRNSLQVGLSWVVGLAKSYVRFGTTAERGTIYHLKRPPSRNCPRRKSGNSANCRAAHLQRYQRKMMREVGQNGSQKPSPYLPFARQAEENPAPGPIGKMRTEHSALALI